MNMTRIFPILALLIVLAGISGSASAQENYIGEIRMFAGTYAPSGWAFCDGQIMQITRNCALFSLLGNRYGGDGRSTFALPNLNGVLPCGTGYPKGLQPRPDGYEQKRQEAFAASVPSSGIPAEILRLDAKSVATPTHKILLQPPNIGVKYIIALQGYYPPRP